MEKIKIIVFAGIILLAASCKKYLDINNNPNSALSATPEVLLPQAITASASTLSTYNSYGSQVAGFMANAGGYGGFGSAVTYNYNSGDNTGLWNTAFDNAEDYQQIITQTDNNLTYSFFNGVARIMRAMDFQLLTDAYNDIPYIPSALQGNNNLTPAYTKAEDVYVSLADQLDSAITIINEGQEDLANNSNSNVKSLGGSDVMFSGNMDLWKKLANTLKLRLIVRASGKATFNNPEFDGIGFLETDAIINPGYTRDNGKQNPQWNTWVYSYTGSAANRAWMATTWALSWYNGTKLNDPRGYTIYYSFPGTGSNQLGYENYSVPSAPGGSSWFSAINEEASATATSAGNSIGVLKGPNAGFPCLLAAESYFLQAEANLRGLITGGDPEDLFNKGLLASFTYLYRLPDNKSLSTDPYWNSPSGDLQYYLDQNPDSYLVHYDLATTDEERLEAIITQKYIALNFIAGHEAWNEYRRTHYPAVSGTSATSTFASLQSVSTQPDRLPTRLLYPTTETSYNPNNVPKNISPFTSFIFWAKQ